jgi:hypothetical protein
MNDLVKRLRDKYASPQDVAEAADLIEELEQALVRIAEAEDQFSMQWAAEIARAALEGKTE